MLTANLSACVVAALTVVLFAPAADVPHFVCKEGVVVQRTLEMKGSRELTKFTMKAGDESADRDDIHRSVVLSAKQVSKDEIKSCSGDKVTGFARTYVTLEKNRTEKVTTPNGETNNEVPETSDLEGKTVAFAWDGEKKAWTRTIGGAADEKLTGELAEDMDYRAFLPEKDAKAGVKWEVDFADVKTALQRPGGDLPFHGKEEIKALDKRLRKAAWEATKGKLELEVGEVREVEGKKVVVIGFKGEMSYDATVGPEGDEKGPKEVRVEDAQKIEGKLMWDVVAGRAESIEWTAKGTIRLTVTGTGKKADGVEVDVQQVQEFDEEYTYSGEFEVK